MSPNILAFTQSVDELSWLSTQSRLLLYHFTTKASHITSCHEHIQTRICRLIIPMALQTPSLLYATMALSALHRSTLIGNLPNKFGLDEQVSSLIASSLESLRGELQAEGGISKYVLLLTIRTLTVCEIHSGLAGSGSWRAHVEGARALLETTRETPAMIPLDELESRWLVDSWYESIESLAALTTRRGLIRGQLEQFGPRALISETNQDSQCLDIYTAYSPSLNAVFKEIGAAAWERRRIIAGGNQVTLLSSADLDEEAIWLEYSVRAMSDRLAFRAVDLQVLAQNQMQEYEACNMAYHQTALIHILRRVQQLPTSDPKVQKLVKIILKCALSIKPAEGLSPWVMLTTPIFTAGCEALGDDRNIVRGLLQNQFKLLRIRNIERSLEILEQIWARDDDNELGDWESSLGTNFRPSICICNNVTNSIGKAPGDWDFIPY